MSKFSSPPFTRDVVQPQPDGSAKVDQAWYSWFLELSTLFSKGVTTNITLAKLTPGGTTGSLAIRNGIITAVIPPT